MSVDIPKGVLGAISGAKFGPLGSIVGGIGGLFGGKGEQNIAKNLSKQVGCTIPQNQANKARKLLKQGINPCTGARRAKVPVAPGPAARSVPVAGIDDPRFTFNQPRPEPTAIPLFDARDTDFIDFLMDVVRGRDEVAEKQTEPVETSFSTTPFIPQPTGVAMSALPAIIRGGGAIFGGALGGGAVGAVGRSTVARRAAVSMLKTVGIQVGAAALGITVVEAAQLILAEQQAAARRRRRGQGITGAQLRTAKRVNCKIKRMAADLGCGVKATTRRAPVRRKTCR